MTKQGKQKQIKITKLFKKGAVSTKLPDDCAELQEEIKQLKQQVLEKHNELFQLQRNSYRHKLPQPKKKDEVFVRPQKIIVQNSVDSLKRTLELMATLTSMEVQSYVANEHCCILFHIQHKSKHEVKHGLKIDLSTDANEISTSSLPLGFNLAAVMEDYDNVMKPDCLGAIRKALFAYYDRLEQFQMLKKLVNINAKLFKTLDGSHMEITMTVQNERDVEDEECSVTLLLDYRVYDIRPKNYAIKDSDMTEDAADLIREQCAVFKKKPLPIAFKDAFVDGVGPFNLVQDIDIEEEKQPRQRKGFQPRHNTQNDDTFQPEDCSDISDDEQQ